jgi:hypothetical protein
LSAIFGTFSHFQLFQPFSTIIKLTYLPTSPKSLAQVIHAFRKLSEKHFQHLSAIFSTFSHFPQFQPFSALSALSAENG